MVSVQREPITEVWGHSPRRGPGAPEAERFFAFAQPDEFADLS